MNKKEREKILWTSVIVLGSIIFLFSIYNFIDNIKSSAQNKKSDRVVEEISKIKNIIKDAKDIKKELTKKQQ